jgi:hypothetical protein
MNLCNGWPSPKGQAQAQAYGAGLPFTLTEPALGAIAGGSETWAYPACSPKRRQLRAGRL